MPFLTGFYSK
ncbi:hypothetical protein CP02DC15_1128A, partial [Chlamydia psittaci 02DC15]